MTLAVLCPGQGGQHDGMFDAITREPDGRALLTGFALPDASHLFDNAVAQPAICALQVATWSLLAPRLDAAGVEPALFAGYSVGELGAHGSAGAFTFDDTIALARARASAMDAASRAGDGLAALRGLGRGEVDALCAKHEAYVAIVNDDDQWIVGGHDAALVAIVRDANARGFGAQRLPVAVAAHTPLLAEAARAFRKRLEATPWSTPTARLIAGIDASSVRTREAAIDALSRQLAITVRWSDCMDAIREHGTTVALELGPGNALSRMLRERHGDLAVRSVSDFRSLDAVVEWVLRSVG